jgi:O-antigen/teichoic acid export membrane protein
MLSFSAPLAVSGSMWFIFSDIDTFLLGALATTTAVGVYKVAYTLGKLVFLAKTAFEFLAMPIFSEYHAKDDISNMRSIYIILAKWTLILALPITLTMMLLPRLVIRITFGTEYVAGGTALSILAIGFIIHVISGANTSCLSAMGYTKLVMWDVGGAAILNIGLNVIFIPQYTVVGAAVATVLSYVILNTVAGYQLYRKNQIQPFSWRVFAILLSGTGSYILLLRLIRPTDLVSLLMYLSLFGIVYIALVAVFAVSNEEIKLLSTHLDSTHWLIRLLNRVNF